MLITERLSTFAQPQCGYHQCQLTGTGDNKSSTPPLVCSSPQLHGTAARLFGQQTPTLWNRRQLGETMPFFFQIEALIYRTGGPTDPQYVRT